MIIELKETPDWGRFSLTVFISLVTGYLFQLLVKLVDYFSDKTFAGYGYETFVFFVFLIIGIGAGTYWTHNYKLRERCLRCQRLFYGEDLTCVRDPTSLNLFPEDYFPTMCTDCFAKIKSLPFISKDKQFKLWDKEMEKKK